MKDFRQIAAEINQAKEELTQVWLRIDGFENPKDPPIEEHMRTVDVLFERVLDNLDPMNSKAEEIVSDYCEMAMSVFSDARTAASHSTPRQRPSSDSLRAALKLAEKATARAFREGAEEDAIV